MKVCEKVKKKGTTSYNEVADELVGEFTNPTHANSLTDQVKLALFLVNLKTRLDRKINLLYLFIYLFAAI